MKMRNAAAITLSLLLALSCAARDTPIYNGKLTSDLDASGFYIRNLPPDFFPTGPGGEVKWTDIIGRPTWINDNVPTYPVELNAATNQVLIDAKAYTDAHAGGDIPAYWALANVTNAQGGAVFATDIGALPVDGIAQEANHAETADRANTAAYANESDNANYASSAGGVFWFDISGVPSWIGDDKPTYTAEEVGAAPAKTMLTLGGTSSNYDLRLNGVAQSFEQVSNYVAHGEVIAKHLNGFYKPTYISASEIMFDCTGFIAGDVSTRRIHMVKSNNKVVLDDTKVLAEEAWVLGLSTTYTNLAGSAFVSLNQSVQTVTVDGAPVTISMPTAVQGGTRDFVVYVNNTSAATDAPLVLPAGTYYADDDAATNAFTKGTVSALYITEMDGAFMIGRKELKQIVVQ